MCRVGADVISKKWSDNKQSLKHIDLGTKFVQTHLFTLKNYIQKNNELYKNNMPTPLKYNWAYNSK